VLKLGTAQHHDALLGAIDSLDATGCFALTELGFGPRPCPCDTSLFTYYCGTPRMLCACHVPCMPACVDISVLCGNLKGCVDMPCLTRQQRG
jgi:hypothetical protein